MRFGLFVPDLNGRDATLLLTYLSGLTCTYENVMTKGGAFAACVEHGVALLMPDTSPRGEQVADVDQYDLGQGASFYLSATQEPWRAHYQMERYVVAELPALVESANLVHARHRSIMGHSMGGLGALHLYFRHPNCYERVSALSPIVAPSVVPWGQAAFRTYLGEDCNAWHSYDPCHLAQRCHGEQLSKAIRIDQGLDDEFLVRQLKPELFEQACAASGIPLDLQCHPGFDHSYFFVQSFMAAHIQWHSQNLSQNVKTTQ